MLWEELLGHAEITLNMLRAARNNPFISAGAAGAAPAIQQTPAPTWAAHQTACLSAWSKTWPWLPVLPHKVAAALVLLNVLSRYLMVGSLKVLWRHPLGGTIRGPHCTACRCPVRVDRGVRGAA
jgi:hypothetical protein